MKKRAISFILAALMLVALAGPALAREEKTSTVTVTVLVEPTYEDALGFSDGLAAVKKDGKWGYIDETGKVVIDFKYSYAENFGEGYALVTRSRGSGFFANQHDFYIVDKTGKETPLQVAHVWQGEKSYENLSTWYLDDLGHPILQNGVIVVEGYAFGTDGLEIVPDEEELNALADKCESKGLYGYRYIDYSYTYGCANVCVDGLIPMYLRNDFGDIWVCFLMDKTGHVVKDYVDMAIADWDNDNVKLPDGIAAPVDGLMTMGITDGITYDTSYGMMDYTTGNWVIQPKYAGYRYNLSGIFFMDGLWIVKGQNDKYGAVNKSGQEVIPLEYDFLGAYEHGLSPASKNGEWFYLDTYGNRYEVGLPGGGTAKNLAVAGGFSSKGVAVVYDKDTGKGYLITDTPVNGVLPAVEGSDGIAISTYFPNYDGTMGSLSVSLTPSEIIAFEKDGKYGYYKLTFDLAYQNPFTDVLPGSYYFKEVVWAASEKIVDASVAEFKPETDCPRWQVVDALWRAAGRPEPTLTESPFVDVTPADSFYKAVLWANEKGIALGDSENTFSPNDAVKRCDALTLLYRAAGEPETARGTNFPDVPDDVYYTDAISWAVNQADPIAKGVETGCFEPDNAVIKCDMMILLYRTAESNGIDITIGAKK